MSVFLLVIEVVLLGAKPKLPDTVVVGMPYRRTRVVQSPQVGPEAVLGQKTG